MTTPHTLNNVAINVHVSIIPLFIIIYYHFSVLFGSLINALLHVQCQCFGLIILF